MNLALVLAAQNASVRGQLQDAEKIAVEFANVVLYSATDSSMVKVETTDEAGLFHIKGIEAGKYYLVASHIGSADLEKEAFDLAADQQLDFGVLQFAASGIELEEAIVTASRVIVETKPDRTIFNVEGTINSTGSDAIELLRKAPGVLVDNNNNISVLGRAGVLLYVDGKRLPLAGDDLVNFLQNLPAEQIDRMDIITNPGARYEAEGNAGIIDIRLKRDKRFGANGSVNGTYTQGRYSRSNIGGSGNFRNKAMNAFGSISLYDGQNYNDMTFLSFQNGLRMDEVNENVNGWQGFNIRGGVDFFLGEFHTIGILASGGNTDNESRGVNVINIGRQDAPTVVDSILDASAFSDAQRTQQTYNLNYRFDNQKGTTLNIDFDYGRYENDIQREQPNRFLDPETREIRTEVSNSFDTPTDIDIYTFKIDFEKDLWGGRLGVGTKFSDVISDNSFLVFDGINGNAVFNDSLSNTFDYDEKVYAGYISYSRQLSEKWNFSAGLRAEYTDATGVLQAFKESLQEPPVELEYLSWFPNIGFTYQLSPMQTLALNYGRRINRPDYNVLNPFNSQLSLLSYEKGNPFLSPEIVNNVELGYTLNYRYNFKLSYSLTTDQITRLIAPDENDDRAGFITWDNLAEQTVIGFNFSAPVEMKPWWNSYFNFSASYLDNQADYGDGRVVDVQAFTYSIYQQHTFDLPWALKAEVGGYYSGPGVWGGVFEYESSWSLDVGLQRKFMDNKLNARLSIRDIFFETGWDGVSEFAGLVTRGSGNWDSRSVSLSLSYNFGNQNVKSRKRKAGLEDEAGRISGGN
ncbi:MAG: TonB-dependent receptor [Bacteroidota bacterium]